MSQGFTIVTRDQVDTAIAMAKIMDQFYRDHDRYSKFSQSDIDSGLASWIISKALSAKTAANMVWYELEDQYEAQHEGSSLGAMQAAKRSLHDQGMCYCVFTGYLCDVCSDECPDVVPAWIFCETYATRQAQNLDFQGMCYCALQMPLECQICRNDREYVNKTTAYSNHPARWHSYKQCKLFDLGCDCDVCYGRIVTAIQHGQCYCSWYGVENTIAGYFSICGTCFTDRELAVRINTVTICATRLDDHAWSYSPQARRESSAPDLIIGGELMSRASYRQWQAIVAYNNA